MKKFPGGGGGENKQGVLWTMRKWRTANFLTLRSLHNFLEFRLGQLSRNK